MEKVLLGVGAISFIGYLIWLVVCVKNWDSKIPPIIGMVLSVVMILGGLSTTTKDSFDINIPSIKLPSMKFFKNSVAECENLINEIGEIETDGVVSPQGDVLYLGTNYNAYKAAKAKYESLSARAQSKVKNAYILEENQADYEEATALQEKLQIERDIMLECKDAAVDELKPRLKSPSSYEELDYSILVSDDLLENGKGLVFVTITYSATNSFGGRLQDKTSAHIDCTYHDGSLSIKDISFYPIL